jgi:hypothetical protein
VHQQQTRAALGPRFAHMQTRAGALNETALGRKARVRGAGVGLCVRVQRVGGNGQRKRRR